MTVWSSTRKGGRFLNSLVPSPRETSGWYCACAWSVRPNVVEHSILPLRMRPPAFKYCDWKTSLRKNAISASEQTGYGELFIRDKTARDSALDEAASAKTRFAYWSSLDSACRIAMARPSKYPLSVPRPARTIVENTVTTVRWK